jgi:predicted AAA+ superfamily ATPase
VGRKAVESYVRILEDLLLAFRLPVFTRRSRRQPTRQLYYCDTGIFRSLRPAGPLDRPAEIDGGALEGLVDRTDRLLALRRC